MEYKKLLNQGIILSQSGDLMNAVHYLKWAVLAADGNNKVEAIYELASLYEKQRKFKLALSEVEKIPAGISQELSTEIFELTFRLYIKTQKFGEAKKLLDFFSGIIRGRRYKYLKAQVNFYLGNFCDDFTTLLKFHDGNVSSSEFLLLSNYYLGKKDFNGFKEHVNYKWSNVGSWSYSDLVNLERLIYQCPVSYFPEKFFEDFFVRENDEKYKFFKDNIAHWLERNESNIQEQEIARNYPIYVISLDSDKERLDRAEFFSELYNVKLSLFSAVNGKSLGKNDVCMFSSRFLKQRMSNLDFGAVGCFLSHINLWKKIVKENIEYALITEDDGMICSNLPSDFDEFSFPNDFDLVYVNDRSSGTDDESSSIFDVVSVERFSSFRKATLNYCVPGQIGNGTDGYFISNKGAKKLISRLEWGEIDCGIDPFLRDAAISGKIHLGAYGNFTDSYEYFYAYSLINPFVYHLPMMGSDRSNRDLNDENENYRNLAEILKNT